MIDGMTADQWRDGFFRRGAMTYAEALLWIAYRDADRIAGVVTGPTDWRREPSTWVAGLIEIGLLDETELVIPAPSVALAEALAAGGVTAMGRRLVVGETRSGREVLFMEESDHETLAPFIWQTHHIADAFSFPEALKTTAAVRRASGPVGLNVRHGWGDLFFLAAGVFQCFPGAGAVVGGLMARPANDATPSWYPRPGEGQAPWMGRSDVLAEAHHRLTSGATQKLGYPGVLLEMAAEAGTTWTISAIRKAYAETGKPTHPAP